MGVIQPGWPHVFWVGFSPDGHTLASSSADRTIRLWNVTSLTAPKLLGAPLTGHTAAIDGAAFSPDGQILATASDDHTVELTEMNATAAIARICAATAGNLTPGQLRQYLPDLPYNPPCP